MMLSIKSLRSILSFGVLISAGLAKAGTWNSLGSYLSTPSTYIYECALYQSVTANEVHHFVGDFHVAQECYASTETAPWTTPFATLTSNTNYFVVHFDIDVTIPTAGNAAWISLATSHLEGAESWRYVPGPFEVGKRADRTLFWDTVSGSPYQVISP